MLLQSSPLLSSVSRMEFKDVKCFAMAWSLGRFALAQGEKGRCATSAFHMVAENGPAVSAQAAGSAAGSPFPDNDDGNDETEQSAH